MRERRELEFDEFRVSCLGGKPGGLLREASIYVSYPLYLLGIHPDIPTALMGALNLTVPLFFLSDDYRLWLMPPLYFAFVLPMLDMINGNLARGMKLTSSKGAFLDAVLDYVLGKACFFILLATGLSMREGSYEPCLPAMVILASLYIHNASESIGREILRTRVRHRGLDEEPPHEKTTGVLRIAILFTDPTCIGLCFLASLLLDIVTTATEHLTYSFRLLILFSIFYSASTIWRVKEWIRRLR
jgi:phosphatidylglycerophosphate synthase